MTLAADQPGASAAAAHTSPRLRVAAFAALLLAVGLAALAATDAPLERADGAWALPVPLLALAFALAEASALHVEIRKESHSLSLGSIPLMFGIVFVSPVGLAVAYVVGGGAALLLVRRSGLLKACWNASLFVAQTGIAVLFVRSVLGSRIPENAIEWLVPLIGVLLAELISLFAVSLVIMAVDATFRPHLFADVGQSQILAVLAGTYTVTVAASSTTSSPVVLYALLPLVGVGLLLRRTGRVSQRLKDVQQLHHFTADLANERGMRTLDTGLVELAQIMRSRSAGLLLASAGDETATIRMLADDRLTDVEVTPQLARLIAATSDSGVIEITPEHSPSLSAVLAEQLDATRVLATAVLGEADRSGVLFVADRLGMRDEFNADDRRLFASLASTLSSRLSNDVLVERLEAQARSDALTGLPNRLNFEVALTAELARSDRRGVVLMVDLDRFKEINDSLGHDMGDRLLIEIADRLRSATRSTDIAARFGGDEFALVLVEQVNAPPGTIEAQIERIYQLLIERIEIDGIRFEVGASIGVARWPEQGTDSDTLLRRADTAMYESKRRQVGPIWYDVDLDAEAPRRLELYISCPDAFDNGELDVLFQPKISIADGHLTGAEALARWTHAEYGAIPPDEFVPLMVHAGVIGRLTRFVIHRAAEAALALADAGHDVPIAVNLTPRDLLDPLLVDDISSILETVGAPATSLLIEITEDAMVVDIDTAVSSLLRMRAMGMQVAIDDFGTGYSSMQHLHRLPLDQLKVDRSFVDRMTDDDSAWAIVRASVNLAHDLGMSVVAEGVETVAAFDRLRIAGCDEIQGFLIEPPLHLRDLLGWTLEWQPHRIDTSSDRRALSASMPFELPTSS